jgi:hypothetical protein
MRTTAKICSRGVTADQASPRRIVTTSGASTKRSTPAGIVSTATREPAST